MGSSIHLEQNTRSHAAQAGTGLLIGWLDSNTMAIEPSVLPKHPRNEARNASCAGRHHHFWHLPHLELQLSSGNIVMWTLGWHRCNCPPKDRAAHAFAWN
jgi:hypothetical protein